MISLKFVSLIVLVFMTSLNVLLVRHTRTVIQKPMYIASTAVLMGEILKFCVCVIVILQQGSINQKSKEILHSGKDSLKLAVPALLYVVQNNLLYIALSNLDAATYQVTYQLKILSTALFAVAMLKRRLSKIKWISLVVLTTGVILVQLKDNKSEVKSTEKKSSSSFIGFVAIALASLSSGFSGIYFEKIVKGSQTSLWIRNLQLAFFSIIMGIISVVANDLQTILQDGFFQGYNSLVWFVIFTQGANGLIIGAVVKYADNILKGFATSISIILSSVVSYFLFTDFQPSQYFVFGATAVIFATYLYSLPEPVTKPK